MQGGAPYEALLIERQRARSVLEALDEELIAIVESAVGANGDDEHDPEGATVAFERQRTAALKAQAVARLVGIEQALAAFGDGGYGICRHCGEPIPAERLDALPGVDACVSCAGPSRARPSFSDRPS